MRASMGNRLPDVRLSTTSVIQKDSQRATSMIMKLVTKLARQRLMSLNMVAAKILTAGRRRHTLTITRIEVRCRIDMHRVSRIVTTATADSRCHLL